MYNGDGYEIPLSTNPGPMTWTIGDRIVQGPSDEYQGDGDRNWMQSFTYKSSIEDDGKQLACSLGGHSENNFDAIKLKIVTRQV